MQSTCAVCGAGQHISYCLSNVCVRAGISITRSPVCTCVRVCCVFSCRVTWACNKISRRKYIQMPCTSKLHHPPAISRLLRGRARSRACQSNPCTRQLTRSCETCMIYKTWGRCWHSAVRSRSDCVIGTGSSCSTDLLGWMNTAPWHHNLCVTRFQLLNQTWWWTKTTFWGHIYPIMPPWPMTSILNWTKKYLNDRLKLHQLRVLRYGALNRRDQFGLCFSSSMREKKGRRWNWR